jgi:hypothetical protein
MVVFDDYWVFAQEYVGPEGMKDDRPIKERLKTLNQA